MSDLPPDSTGRPDALKRRRPSAPRRRPPPQNFSAKARRYIDAAIKSKYAGYVVLGAGAFILIAVLIIAFSGGPDLSGKQADVKTAQSLKRDLAPVPAPQATVPASPVPKKDLYFRRQTNIQQADVQGSWQAAIGRYTAVLQLQKNVYQIILAEPGNSKRIFSAGVYSMGEDILILTPRLDWADPSTRGGARVPYEIMTRAPFPVIAAIMQGKMVWQNPPQSEKRVLTPYKTPLAAGQDVNYIVWQRMK